MSDHTNPLFADRHIGPDSAAVTAMLEVIGVDSLEELARRALPAGILDGLTGSGAAPGLDQLPPAATEAEALAELRTLADANTVAVSMIGQGYYDTYTPPVLLRNILENPAWYTAYTPYQPEISQGRLEALLNFQTMVADLTGLEVANASMLDEGTAAAEAMTLMHRAVKGNANRLAVDVDVFAQTAAVLATRAEPLGIEIVTADLGEGLPDGEFFGVIAQLPAAWPAGRRLSGRRWLTRLPVGTADSRAAHPPGQGDQQHLHRSGAVGGDGRDVCELPRRRRTNGHRPARARPRRDDRRRTRRCVGARQVL